MKELDMLLENYWILKENDKDLYYKTRDSLQEIRPLLYEKLGYQIIVNPYLVKLEKMPGKTESWMGIEGFSDKMEYSFLCLILMFLEDKGREEQFLLSEVTEFIEATFPGDEKVDWTLYRHRKYLINVMKFLANMGIIKINDGDGYDFTNTVDSEVLYENTGISTYFVRNFTGNIMDYSSLEDFENDEWIDIDRDRGRIRRNRVYRRIIMSPAIYNEGVEDQDYLYIKNYRNMIQSDLEKYFDSELHVHKNGAFLVLGEDKNYKKAFPENKTISDIVLQMNGLILENLEEEKLNKEVNDTINISLQGFNSLARELKEKYSFGWSKEYREMKEEKLCENIIAYMKDYNMIEINEDFNEVKIMPIVGKIIGKYPQGFIDSQKENEEDE